MSDRKLISHGVPHAYGVVEAKPLVGFPDGHLQIVMSNRNFVKVFVRTKDGTRKFFCRDHGSYWSPTEQARKIRVKR